ncbi:Gcp-like domain-containing protein [Lentinula detonsa]|uniref:N(6)-L-threonylcarbamoyladenine synthase n=1 Tax=Lentinula detonsa TaxID=2804962 RepID=A0A9W8P5D3_9AGAR|nr:Gcp-like domain-containing protein [Lentinula detonsa]KAJ3986589.1 Gcp-like domain-containing protein [Lentinula detonsa]
MLTSIRSLPFRRTAHHLHLSRLFTVLAFESSADDTCAAVVTSDRQILSNVVIRQNDLVQRYGGIHPGAAVLAHQANLPLAAKRALAEAKVDLSDVDGIAFTRGPGMGVCLAVTLNAAKTLAAVLNKPIVGVHHMQAHALTALLTTPTHKPNGEPNPAYPRFPYLTLLVSGGHTQIVLAKSVNSFDIMATTLDESIGRTIDKVSRLLQIEWANMSPGSALEKFCLRPEEGILPDMFVPFTPVMPRRLAFSYSALHSHVDRLLDLNGGVENFSFANKLAIARVFQNAAFGQLEEKLGLALVDCEKQDIKVGHLVVSGGVASNMLLRERLNACLKAFPTSSSVEAVFPPVQLCTDNAAMVGWASMPRFLAGNHDEYTINPRSKWSIEDLETEL